MSDTAVDEFLEHHGVKGMKWGRHKAEGGGSRSERKAAKKQAGVERDNNINAARDRLAKKDSKIATLTVKSLDGKTEKGRVAANKALQKALDDYDNDPDRIVAAQKTGKEKTRHILNVILNGVDAYN